MHHTFQLGYRVSGQSRFHTNRASTGSCPPRGSRMCGVSCTDTQGNLDQLQGSVIPNLLMHDIHQPIHDAHSSIQSPHPAHRAYATEDLDSYKVPAANIRLSQAISILPSRRGRWLLTPPVLAAQDVMHSAPYTRVKTLLCASAWFSPQRRRSRPKQVAFTRHN